MAIPKGFTEVSDIPSGFTEIADVPEGFSLIEDEGTSFMEDIKIGWGNVGKLVQDAAEVGVSGVMGLMENLPGAPSDIQEQNQERFRKMQEAGAKTRADLDTWANPENKEQTFGGKAISVIGSLPGQIAAMPLSPAQTGKDFIDAGETLDAAQKAALIDTAGNVVGFGLPGTVGSGVIKKGLTGFGINAAQDVATRMGITSVADTKEIKDKYAPTVETAALSGIVGGGIGALHGMGDKADTSPTKVEDPNAVDESQHVDLGQKEIVQRKKLENEKNIEYAERKIAKLEKDLEDPANARRTPEEAEQYRTAVIEEIVQHQKDITNLKLANETADVILRGDLPPVKPEGTAEAPSSLPPRPEEGAFVRPQEEPISPEQAAQAAMFDQEVPLESPRITPEQFPEQLGTEVPTRMEEPLVDVSEEITITAPRETGTIADIEAGIPVPRPKGLVITGGSERIRSIVTDWVKRLGLDKENIDFNIGGVDSRLLPHEGGNATVRPDGSVEVNIKAAEDIQTAIEGSPTFGREIRKLTAEKAAELKETLTAAHELGHILLGRLLQNDLFLNGKKGVLDTLDGNLGISKLLDDFAKWKETKTRDEQRAAGNLFSKPQSSADYYLDFPEFFAQRVSRELVIGKPSTSGPISKFVNSIRNFIKEGIRDLGLSKAFERNVVDVFISDLIKANEASVKQFGKTIFEMQATSTSLADAWKWQNENLFAIPRATSTVGAGPNMSNASLHIRDAAEVIKEQAASPDIAPLGSGTLFKGMRGLLNTGLNTFSRNWFGIQQQAQLYSSSPAVQHTSHVILSALAKQTQRSMELLAGVTDRAAWDAKRKGVFVSLQKVKDNLSLSIVAAKSSNADFHAVQQIFEQGIGRHTYEESLAKFGEALTPQQRTLYDTLSKLYANMYKMAEGLEGELGKKKIIPNMKGWYPAVRKGEFAVSFHIPGLEGIGGRNMDGSAIMTDLVYRQQFFSREEAQAFIKHFEAQSPDFRGRMQHNGVEDLGKTDLTDNMAEFMRAVDAAKDQLALEEGRGGDIAGARVRLQRLQDQYVVRGGTLGAHHRLRTNVPGAAGAEMFKDVGSAGKAFRDANFSSVDEYTRLMMKMEVGQKLDLILNDEGLKSSHPETMAVVQQMRDYSLNEIKSPLEMKGFKRLVDKIFTDSYTDKSKVRSALGVQKYRDTHVVDVMLGKMSHVFYLHVLMSRPAFWAAQGSQFMWIARSLVKDGAGPVDSMVAAGKGFMTLLRPDKDFLDGVFYQSQHTHTFSPQFINDLNKFHVMDFLKEGSKTKLLVDLATGEKQSTAADTFSRLMSYSMMHEHYKALGLRGEELYIAAGKATDENMVQYGRQYKAPLFQKAGVVGDLLSPLQTFSQAALGNLIADVGQILKTPMGKGKLKASLPFMMTMAITSLMAGVVGAPLVMEYEALRLALNHLAEKMGIESRLPSVLDIVLSGDNDFSHRVLSHGLISSSTMAVTEEGLDIGASNRWQPIISGIVTGEKTWLEAMPTVNFMLQELGYVKDLSMHIAGAKTLSDAERRTAAMGLTPGMYKGITNQLYDEAGGVVPTQAGDAFVENTPTEQVAKFMGTSTITSSTERLRQRRTKEEGMRRQEKTNKKYELMADALFKGDQVRVEELAMDLATNYEQSPRQIRSRMEAEYFRRNIEAGKRQFMGKNGKMSTKQKLDYQRWMETYQDSPFDEDTTQLEEMEGEY